MEESLSLLEGLPESSLDNQSEAYLEHPIVSEWQLSESPAPPTHSKGHFFGVVLRAGNRVCQESFAPCAHPTPTEIIQFAGLFPRNLLCDTSQQCIIVGAGVLSKIRLTPLLLLLLPFLLLVGLVSDPYFAIAIIFLATAPSAVCCL
jgi:hypothetical protein